MYSVIENRELSLPRNFLRKSLFFMLKIFHGIPWNLYLIQSFFCFYIQVYEVLLKIYYLLKFNPIELKCEMEIACDIMELEYDSVEI